MPREALYDSAIRRYACLSTEAVCAGLGTTPQGLPERAVAAMREKHGANQLRERRQDELIQRVRRAFLNPFHGILLLLAAVSAAADAMLGPDFTHDAVTAVLLFVMVAVSGAIRLARELRAESAAEQLDRMICRPVQVKRDGTWQEIPARELVVGDLVRFHAGDRIPADIRLTDARELFVSQAALTGESAVVKKEPRSPEAADRKPVTQLSSLAFMATAVISGTGAGIVLAVGRKTLYGSFRGPDRRRADGFQKGANSIARVLLRFMAVLVPLVVVLLGVTRGKWLESTAFALSVSVGLVPELLPMVLTACLAKGSMAMGRKRTIVRDINAMQAFGGMDVLCMDKTGTLTNESILLEYYMDVLGNEDGHILDLAYLNSAYHSGPCSPIDNAVLACRTMPGRQARCDALLERYRKVDELPLDSVRRRASVLVSGPDGGLELIAKGDVRSITARCSHVEYRGERFPMPEDAAASVSSVVDEMLRDGMKVIAVARKACGPAVRLTPEEECGMTLLGYLAFFDAPKASARRSVEQLRRLDITPKILTGDQAAVAASICRRVGVAEDSVLTGAELDSLTDEELRDAAEQSQVFAELTPGQKLRLVAALRENGHTVGFLGDGINDIPAMYEADVGISVDTAVDAARDAADVLLLEKDLDVLEQGVLEGRRTFFNMRKYIKITASSNFGNILAIVCASVFLPFLPMTSLQILLLNLLYDMLCIVLPWDHVDEEALCSPGAWSGRDLSRFMLWFGPISSLFDLATFFFLYHVLCPLACGGAAFAQIADPALRAQFIALFQTGWFLESMWTQVLILHFLRTAKLPLIQSRPSAPVLWITLSGVLALTGAAFTGGAPVLGLTRLPAGYLLFLLAAAALYMILTTVCKYFYQKRYRELI